MMSYAKKEGWLGSRNVGVNKNAELNSAGCRSQEILHKQWGDNFEAVNGLNSAPVYSDEALIDLERAARIDALKIENKETSPNE